MRMRFGRRSEGGGGEGYRITRPPRVLADSVRRARAAPPRGRRRRAAVLMRRR